MMSREQLNKQASNIASSVQFKSDKQRQQEFCSSFNEIARDQSIRRIVSWRHNWTYNESSISKMRVLASFSQTHLSLLLLLLFSVFVWEHTAPTSKQEQLAMLHCHCNTANVTLWI